MNRTLTIAVVVVLIAFAIVAAALAQPASSKPVRWSSSVASVFYARSEPALGCWPWRPSELRPGVLVVAHRTARCGSRVRVCYRRCVTARVRDRGPYANGADFDLDTATAKAAGVPYGVYRIRHRWLDE